MKKSIIFFTSAVALLLCGISVTAHNSKSPEAIAVQVSASPSADITVNDFFNISGGYVKSFKSTAAIGTMLTKRGYTLKSQKLRKGNPYADYDDDREDLKIITYTKGGTTIKLHRYTSHMSNIDIICGSREKCNAIVANMRSSGWRFDGRYDNRDQYYYRGNREADYAITVEGNRISLYLNIG